MPKGILVKHAYLWHHLDDFPEIQFESPIEKIFYREAVGLFHPLVRIQVQETVLCGKKKYRPDFVLEVLGKRVAVECDGKDFHEYQRDADRDLDLLSHGIVDTIYHFKGESIYYNQADVGYILFRHEPLLFSERGKRILKSTATYNARLADYSNGQGLHCIKTGEMTEEQYRERFERDGDYDPAPYRPETNFAMSYTQRFSGETNIEPRETRGYLAADKKRQEKTHEEFHLVDVVEIAEDYLKDIADFYLDQGMISEAEAKSWNAKVTQYASEVYRADTGELVHRNWIKEETTK